MKLPHAEKSMIISLICCNFNTIL